jgi:hypothetical protein
MSNITESVKFYLNLSDIQFLAKLNPQKKETLKLQDILGSHIKEDGGIEFYESLGEKLSQISIPSPKIKKWIHSLVKSIQDNKNTISPYHAFHPKEYDKLAQRLRKFTLSKKFQKWTQDIPSQTLQVIAEERVSSDKVDSILRKLNPFLKSLQIHKEIKVFVDAQNSILNFKFSYHSQENEIHFFIPKELEKLLDEENLFLLFLLFLSRYLNSELQQEELIKRIDQKLILYINQEPDFIKSDMVSIFGNKWEDFLTTYYSLKQIQELIYDRISIFLAGSNDKILELYQKLNEIKEESYESDGEIFLIEDLWVDHKFSKDITSELPDYSIRKHFLQSYKGGYLSGKTIKKNKIWNSHDRKELKELYF